LSRWLHQGSAELFPETLALDAIHEVGPGGDYVTSEHTLRHYKRCWYPDLFDRLSYKSWVDAGRPTLIESARAAARDAVARHTPEPLPAETLDTLRSLIAAADGRAGV